MPSVCAVKLHVTFNGVKIFSLRNNDFVVNSFDPQQRKVYVSGFERNDTATNSAPVSHVAYKRCV